MVPPAQTLPSTDTQTYIDTHRQRDIMVPPAQTLPSIDTQTHTDTERHRQTQRDRGSSQRQKHGIETAKLMLVNVFHQLRLYLQ